MDPTNNMLDDFEETPENFVQDIRDLIKVHMDTQKEKKCAEKTIKGALSSPNKGEFIRINAFINNSSSCTQDNYQ